MWHSSLLSVVTFALFSCLSAPQIAASTIPVISDISKDVVGNIGDDVEFHCTVSNVGRMSVSWAKYTTDSGTGSVVLSMRNILSLSEPRYSIIEEKDHGTDSATYTFKIKAVEVSDMGAYECQVIVSAVDKITEKLKLFVRHPPVISKKLTPRSMLVTEGKSLEVSCHANGFPQPTITWRRQDGSLMPAGGLTYEGPTLRISQAHRLDFGDYFCIAANGVGDPVKRLIHIEVEFSPEIVVQRPKVAQALSHMAQLQCIVKGYPLPSAAWYRNGVALTTNAHYEITNMSSSDETIYSLLRIKSITEDDLGDYHCIAENKLGRAVARLNLFPTVIPVPLSVV